MFDFIRYFGGLFFWILTWCVAFWRGRWPERWNAVVTIALSALEPLIQKKTHDFSLDPGLMLIDVAYTVFLIYLIAKSGRIWPIVVAGFQLIAILVHVAAAINPPKSQFVYLTVTVLVSYLLLIGFQGGLVENEFRRRAERRAIDRATNPNAA